MNLQPVQQEANRKITINVGSRNSQLALIQTKLVIEQLEQYYRTNPAHLVRLGYQNGIEFNIVSMTTSGDQILDKALPEIGTKSLFTRELEVALLDGQVDFVVHSLKDLPTTLPEGCIIGAITKRDDPDDVVVLKKSLVSKISPLDLLFGSPKNGPQLTKCKIGTSSQRRIAMLRRCNPNLECINIRGNLNTRLAKLDDEDGQYSAIILAKAGMKRMNWSERASSSLSPQVDARLGDWCYAVGQGAIAVECRQNDDHTLRLLAPIVDRQTTLEVTAERSLMRKLEGGCSVPLGVRSSWSNNKLSLSAIVLSLDGQKVVSSSDCMILSGNSTEKEQRGKKSETILTTTGIVLSGQDVELNLIECAELGVIVANKMIELGCLELMRTSSPLVASI